MEFEYLKFWPIWKVIMQISKSQQSLYHIFKDICWGYYTKFIFTLKKIMVSILTGPYLVLCICALYLESNITQFYMSDF